MSITYNVLTLSFTGEYQRFEPAYRSFHKRESIMRFRIVIMVAVFFYAAFGILDAIIAPELKYLFWTIRYAVFCPLALICFWLSFQPGFEKYSQPCIFMLCMAAGLGIEVMILTAVPPVTYYYYAGIILVFITVFTFVRMLFLWSVVCAWLIVLCYEIGTLWMSDTPFVIMMSNNFFFISSNIFCMFAGYYIELNDRKSFVSSLMLEDKKEELTNINEELDERVKERTRELLKSNEELKKSYEREKELVLKLEKDEEVLQNRLNTLKQAESIARLGYFERDWISDSGDMSEGLARLMGYSYSDGLPDYDGILQRIYPEDRFRFDRLYRESVKNKKTFDIKFRIQKGNGDIIHIHETADHRYDSKGNLVSTIGLCRDITESVLAEEKEKQLEHQLQQTQKMETIGTLAGGIAHDFNNILLPILGHSEMLLEDIQDNKMATESVRQIEASALRAKELVQQILTFSRQEKNELHVMRIQPILKEAMKMLRSTIPASIDIKADICSECGPVKADPTQIHQVIMNLATNAYHAMEEDGGVLKVVLEEREIREGESLNPNLRPGRYACLTVGDTGCGMPDDVIEKIFNPFFTTKEKGRGTGMGLSVVHGIITRMAGDIQVTTRLGEGSEFKIYLPVEKDISAFKTGGRRADIRKGTESLLIVDDDSSITSVEEKMLKRLGYKVTSRTSAIEALEAFKANPYKYDLVITDYTMPNMSGDRFVSELKAVKPDIKIILCTGFSEKMTTESAKEIGISEVVLKPVIMSEFADTIRRVLDTEN